MGTAIAACWGVTLALKFQQPVGRAADAGGDVRPRADDHGLRAAGAAAAAGSRTIARVNPLTQVVDAARQGFVGGGQLGRHLAGDPGAGRAAAVLGALRPARDAPHRAVRARRRAGGRDRRAGPAAATGPRASGPRPCPSPTRGRAPAGTRGSGTGTRASRRSSGAASTADRSRAELESLLDAPAPRRVHRPHDLLGPAGLLARLVYYNVSLAPREMTGTIQPPLLAWAWRIAVGDPAAEPRIAAQHEWLRGQPRPRRRRPAVARAARRVGARLLAEVRPGLGLADRRRLGFPLLVARNRRLGWDARRIRERGGPVLCEVMTNVLWCLSLLALGRALDHPGAGRSALGRAARALPRRGQAGRARGRRSRPGPRSPRSPCPTCPRRSAAGWSRSTCSTRALLAPRRPALGLGRGAELRARAAAAGCSAATGAGRPGSTRPGCSGWGCAASATTSEAERMAARLAGAVEREGLREYYDPRDGEGLGAARLRLDGLIARDGRPATRTARATAERWARARYL